MLTTNCPKLITGLHKTMMEPQSTILHWAQREKWARTICRKTSVNILPSFPFNYSNSICQMSHIYICVSICIWQENDLYTHTLFTILPYQEDSLQKEMATHSSILAWKIPWMEEPDRLQSMESQRVGHDWASSLSLSFIYLIIFSHFSSFFKSYLFDNCLSINILLCNNSVNNIYYKLSCSLRIYFSIITLNVNGINAPTKRHRLDEWIQKQDPYIQDTQVVFIHT